MALEQKDVEVIERLIYKNADDIAVAISRSFERLEERMDAIEDRLVTRITDGEDAVNSLKQDVMEEFVGIRGQVSDLKGALTE